MLRFSAIGSRSSSGSRASTEPAGFGSAGCGSKSAKPRGYGVRREPDGFNGSAGIADAGGDDGEFGFGKDAFGRVKIHHRGTEGTEKGKTLQNLNSLKIKSGFSVCSVPPW